MHVSCAGQSGEQPASVGTGAQVHTPMPSVLVWIWATRHTPDSHRTPQAPQLVGSTEGFTHVPRQQMPCTPGNNPKQKSPSAWSLHEVGWQLSSFGEPQHAVSGGHSLDEPLLQGTPPSAATQTKSTQADPAGHFSPHPPQLFESTPGATQAPPQHEPYSPVAHWQDEPAGAPVQLGTTHS
jgi:hypothetical protein